MQISYNEIKKIGEMKNLEVDTDSPIMKISGLVRGFQINTIPSDFSYEELLLPEKIITKDGEDFKSTYIFFTEDDLRFTGSGKMALNTENVHGINLLLSFFTQHEALIEDLKIERMVTFDGWEVFHSHKWKLDLLEVQSVASNCNDKLSDYLFCYLGSDSNKERPHLWETSRDSSLETNQLFTVNISKPVIATLYKSGVIIAELTYPCNKATQFDILRQVRKIDPPSINIIFPKQYKAK